MGKLLSMTIVCVAMLFAAAAYAQTGPQKVTVGFEFTAGGKVCRPGNTKSITPLKRRLG